MSIDRFDFENLSEADLQDLLEIKKPEGIRIEYKRGLYGNSDSDKKEAMKDISSFANQDGGFLILGVDEENGVPINIPGIPDKDPDAEILRLEHMCRDGIEPPILGIRFISIRLSSECFVIVGKIPKSWNPPHRVCAQKSNSFWIRDSAGKHEASMEELRSLFNLSSTAVQAISQFRIRRFQEIKSDSSSKRLVGNGRLIVHIIPLSAALSSQKIDLGVVSTNPHSFAPIGSSGGYSVRYNFDGFIIERSGTPPFGYTQIFRNGSIEATKGGLVRSVEGRAPSIAGMSLEKYLMESLPEYFKGLRNLSVSPPLFILMSLENVQGANYSVFPQPLFENPSLLDRPDIFLPECVVEKYGDENFYQKVIKPALDTLWNTFGEPYDRYYNEEGIWDGKIH
jgi:hypothetical protein